jgi:hypothetical protein
VILKKSNPKKGNIKLHSLTLTTALFAVFLTNAPAQSFITNGLVAYYPFNGNANDASGNGNNPTNIQATLCADRFGNPNSAYSFNGTNSYIGFTNVPTTQITNWSVTAWVMPASLDQSGIAVCMGYDDGHTGNGYSLGVSGNQVPGGQLYAIFGYIGFYPGGFTFTNTNQWYQVVMLRNSGVTTFFVNGVATSNSITTTPFTPTSFRIGSENGVRFFNGAINDVRIYNRALASNEVATLYAVESDFCSPHEAQATAQVVNGFLVGATITDNGCGYTNVPEVLIQGGGGSGATATATLENGFVTGINIINPGSGYTNLPDILIASPPFVPTLAINVSRVNVIAHVVLGFNYQIESSTDLVNWTAAGSEFTAQSEYVTNEFIVNQTGQYFRIRQVP